MANTIKSTKRTKREMVIPFEGEEMFVVPKRGGFGQPDMDGYVMAVGTNAPLNTATSTDLGLEVPRSGTTTTSTTSSGTTLSGTPTRATDSTTSQSSTTLSGTTSNPVGSQTTDPRFTTGSTGIGSANTDFPVTSSGSTSGGSTPTTFDPSGTGTLGGGVAVGSGTNLGDAPVGTQTQQGTTTILEPSTMPEMGSNTTTTPPVRIQYGTGLIDLPSGGTGTNQGVVRDQAGNVILSPISNEPVTTTTPPRDNTLDAEIPPMEIPEFPNLSNMNCTDLNSEVVRLTAIMAVSRFPPNVGNAYNNQLATAKTLYTTKCPIKNLDNKELILTPIGGIVTPPIGGGGGGIGGGIGGGFGGGGGMAPEEELPQEEIAPEESGSGKGILLLLAIIGGLYFLTRK
jgi:hypothetical protein